MIVRTSLPSTPIGGQTTTEWEGCGYSPVKTGNGLLLRLEKGRKNRGINKPDKPNKPEKPKKPEKPDRPA